MKYLECATKAFVSVGILFPSEPVPVLSIFEQTALCNNTGIMGTAATQQLASTFNPVVHERACGPDLTSIVIFYMLDQISECSPLTHDEKYRQTVERENCCGSYSRTSSQSCGDSPRSSGVNWSSLSGNSSDSDESSFPTSNAFWRPGGLCGSSSKPLSGCDSF